ncbi:MAG: acyloxyacyl hydrolase [Bacteroidales bacterium]|nr:acyloxyacyl hydrolase [Bacteroidales bacterium]MDZ4204645.1 acyloxyacyl hydrolase [Bacteroidales bacterium]
MKRILFVLLGVFVLLAGASAQKTEILSRHINLRSIGLMFQYGHYFYLLPEGLSYRPILIGGTLHLPLSTTKTRFNYGIDFVPQVGFSFTDKLNSEFGINLYLNANLALGRNSLINFNVGAGPHYTDLVTARQINGFIFSTNFLMAYKHRYRNENNQYELAFFSGLRHISNAQTRKPNIGINNLIFGLTVAKMF